MVPKPKTKKRASKGVRVNAKPKAVRMNKVPSETQAAVKRYADLLLDPCRSELDYAPYGGAKLDYVTRKKAQATVGPAAYQVIFWHPTIGAFGYSNAAGTGTGALLALGPISPFVDSIFVSSRPISGCFSVEWIGAESARQGWINAGIVAGSAIQNSLFYNSSLTAYSIDSWARSATHTERMPIDKFECNWVPGPKDATTPTPYVGDKYGTTQADTSFWAEELEGRNFIMIVMSNITATSSVLMTVTSVAEVSQAASVNVTSNAGTVVRQKFEYSNVIAQFQAKDPGWYINTFKKVSKFTAGALGAYTGGGLPGVLGYLMMGADPSTKAATKNYMT